MDMIHNLIYLPDYVYTANYRSPWIKSIIIYAWKTRNIISVRQHAYCSIKHITMSVGVRNIRTRARNYVKMAYYVQCRRNRRTTQGRGPFIRQLLFLWIKKLLSWSNEKKSFVVAMVGLEEFNWLPRNRTTCTL